MGVPDAHHPKDPRSLAWARAKVYPLSMRARALRWNLGLRPKSFPRKDEMINYGPGGKA